MTGAFPLAMVFLFFASCLALAREAKEDTAFITLQKDPPATVIHEVLRGETLGGILKQRLGRAAAHMSAVRQLNPHLTDINRIYPGQKIILPQPGSPPPPPTAPPASPATYQVLKGDSLGKIFRKHGGGASGGWPAFLARIQALNPELTNPHRLSPGQILKMPGPHQAAPTALPVSAPETKETMKDPPAPALLPAANLEILLVLAERMGAKLIMRGNYHVPLGASGNLTIDNGLIPQIEFPDGAVALLDFDSRVPESLARAVALAWPHIRVINLKGNLLPPEIWARIFSGDPFPLFTRAGRIFLGHERSQLELPAWGFINWKKDGAAQSQRQLIISADSPGNLLPSQLHSFAERTGTIITEILAGKVVPRKTSPEANPPAAAPLLKGEPPGPFAANLLGILGWEVGTSEDISLGDQARDGFSMTIRVPLTARKEGKIVPFIFEPLPSSFTPVFAARGEGPILLDRTMAKRDIILTILKALALPHEHGAFDFPVREIKDGRGGAITFPAIQVQMGEDILYLVDFNLDPHLTGYLTAPGRLNFLRY